MNFLPLSYFWDFFFFDACCRKGCRWQWGSLGREIHRLHRLSIVWCLQLFVTHIFWLFLVLIDRVNKKHKLHLRIKERNKVTKKVKPVKVYMPFYFWQGISRLFHLYFLKACVFFLAIDNLLFRGLLTQATLRHITASSPFICLICLIAVRRWGEQGGGAWWTQSFFFWQSHNSTRIAFYERAAPGNEAGHITWNWLENKLFCTLITTEVRLNNSLRMSNILSINYNRQNN